MNTIDDQEQRLRALDPTESFIVQAPAGSGKTGLLTQRFLTLLGQANYPEEILAITFTRKAAAEMRERIFLALRMVEDNVEPESEYERLTWQLATKAMERNKSQGWNLLATPMRLRILTIDSLSSWLAKQLPLSSQLGAIHSISETPEELYNKAVRRTLQHLESNEDWSHAVEYLIQHLDNNLFQVETLLVSMLGKRDQWLRHVHRGKSNPEMRQELELALGNIVQEHLSHLAQAVKASEIRKHLHLIRFAASNVDPSSKIASCGFLENVPDGDIFSLDQWLGLAELFLTSDGNWRKQITKAVGFPAPSSSKNKEERACYKEMKEQFKELLLTLGEDDALRTILFETRVLPAVAYSEKQWRLLGALFELLPLAVAELHMVFIEHGCIDFTEVSRSAIEALGEAENPTDLALALDYRIQHIMVDEFQDTSFSQFQLLERLAAGWTGLDGRTLFLVGDPMQSIYRFREAEVGFFLWARQNGIGSLALTSLSLTVNFRSQKEIISWVNHVFRDVFSQEDDIFLGAISYSASTANKPALDGEAVQVFPAYENNSSQEALSVIEAVRNIRSRSPNDSIAILAQARSHLFEIVKQLKQHQIEYQAVDIDALGDRVVIQDLSSLTRALLHLNDDVAWLSLLRARWCGLTLGELEHLLHERENRTIWQCINRSEFLSCLDNEAKQRVERFITVMKPALAKRGRCGFRTLVETTWLSLGGPACIDQQAELDYSTTFFQLVEEVEKQEANLQWHAIELQIQCLFAAPIASTDNAIQLMTIHKSKGLEFDHVLLPGLGRKMATDDKRLLLWMERPSKREEGELLLAPLHGSGEKTDSIYHYLAQVERTKLDNESSRLLYVAVTRAKKKLHLFGHVTTALNKDEETMIKPPMRGAMLYKLWGYLKPIYEKNIRSINMPTNSEQTINVQPQVLKRLTNDWRLPEIKDPVSGLKSDENMYLDEKVTFSWSSPTSKYVGTVAHVMLMKISMSDGYIWTENDVNASATDVRRRLRQCGVPLGDLDDAVDRVVAILINVVNHSRGQWILHHGERKESYCEYAVTGQMGDKVVRGVIDRTFIEKDGTRWIIDYKTSEPDNESIEEFLKKEKARYQQQLERYAALLSYQDEKKVMLGLYFPAVHCWVEWSLTDTSMIDISSC